MTSINELSPPSNTLKAAELEGSEVTLTMKSYVVREFDETDKKTGKKYQVKKPIFSFEETDKTFALNKTNRTAISYVYGDEMDNWIGKQIIIYPTMVPFGDEMVESIRVRVVLQGGGAPSFLKGSKSPKEGRGRVNAADWGRTSQAPDSRPTPPVDAYDEFDR